LGSSTVLASLAGCFVLFSGYGDAPLSAGSQSSNAEAMAFTKQAANRDRLTIRGTRITVGNAVDCSQVRADDGKIYPVSYLAPSIAIGDRVEVTGFMANITSCVGLVLYAEEVRRIGN
jgi:hypothetical protein